MTIELQSPQNGNDLPITSASTDEPAQAADPDRENAYDLPPPSVPAPRNRSNRWASLAFTVLPFLVYMLAECITFSGTGLMTVEPFWSSSVTHSIVALGIVPWIIATAIVEIIAVVIPRWRHLRHGGVSGRAKLYWAANILGLLIIAFQADSIASPLMPDYTIALTPSWEFYAP
jgi:preprotein translocase subunit SecY